MTELSPQAQAVYDAVREICPAPADEIAAAALRAAADAVVPTNGSRKNNEIRAELLAIAAELEGGND
jgi:hypothetical protein